MREEPNSATPCWGDLDRKMMENAPRILDASEVSWSAGSYLKDLALRSSSPDCSSFLSRLDPFSMKSLPKAQTCLFCCVIFSFDTQNRQNRQRQNQNSRAARAARQTFLFRSCPRFASRTSPSPSSCVDCPCAWRMARPPSRRACRVFSTADPKLTQRVGLPYRPTRGPTNQQKPGLP